jgi:D-aminopeptidase
MAPILCLCLSVETSVAQESAARPRAREIGVHVGTLATGENNAITDVAGVRVGHKTRIEGDDIRTGVTVILPHGEDIFRGKVPAGIFNANAFGKLVGYTQVEELGEIETPIALTNTLSVGTVMSAVVRHTLDRPGNGGVGSVNAVVGETNDGGLNDIRGMHITAQDVFDAIAAAKSGPVEEGAVGAGTGTRCFGFKGGIGTSSRVTRGRGGYTVGALVQTNFGGTLEIVGAPVARELRRGAPELAPDEQAESDDGSCMIVIATDAPLSPRNLKRLARRASLALGRTGSVMSNGSGDYIIAFSTAYRVGRSPMPELVSNDGMSALFQATVEATEEAIYNSLLKATTVTGRGGSTSRAIDPGRVVEILKQYNLHNLHDRLPPGGSR